MRYRQVDILQHVIPVRPVIAEAEIFQPQRPVIGENIQSYPAYLFLVLLPVYLAEPLQTDLRVLQGP